MTPAQRRLIAHKHAAMHFLSLPEPLSWMDQGSLLFHLAAIRHMEAA